MGNISSYRSGLTAKLRDYEKGLVLRHGRIVGEAHTGLNWLGLMGVLYVIDTRQQELTVPVSVSTADKMPMNFNVVVRYNASNPEEVYKGVENISQTLFSKVNDEVVSRAQQRPSYEALITDRKDLEKELLGSISGFIAPLGYVITAVEFPTLLPPGGIADRVKKVEEAKIEKIIAEKVGVVRRVEADTETDVFKKRKGAAIEMLGKEIDEITRGGAKLKEVYGDQAIDIMYLLMGENLGDSHVLTLGMAKRMEMRAVSSGAKEAAEKVQADPSFIYFLEALKAAKPLTILNASDLDERLSKMFEGKSK